MLKTLLAAGVATTLGMQAAAAADRTLVISVYGFAQDKFDEILYQPFEERCGCDLVVETGNSVERLTKLEARKDDPEVDMAVMSDVDALAAARKDLIAPIDVSRLSNHGKLYDFARNPLGDNLAVGYTFYATSIVYRPDKVTIGSWDDLFSDELAGRVAFPNISTTQGPIALYMVGKAMGDADPTLKAPIARVAEHKDDFVTFYERSSQLIQLLQQDEIWAAPTGRYSWSGIAKLDVPMAWATPKEGQTGGMNVMVLVKGAKNADLAHEFMDFWLSTEIQTALAEALVDSPANAEVTLPDDVAENLTYGAETAKVLDLMPAGVILDHREQWLAEWNQAVAR